MRHRKAGYKLGRNTSHRRALLRNLVTSILIEDRVETTLTKAKAVRPHVERMITLGKKGDLHARRQALSFLMTGKQFRACLTPSLPVTAIATAVTFASSALASSSGDGGKRHTSNCSERNSFSKKRQKRDEIKAKKRKELEAQLEEANKEQESKGGEEAA